QGQSTVEAAVSAAGQVTCRRHACRYRNLREQWGRTGEKCRELTPAALQETSTCQRAPSDWCLLPSIPHPEQRNQPAMTLFVFDNLQRVTAAASLFPRPDKF